MRQFEYKIVTFANGYESSSKEKTQQKLNEYGLEGWEVVSCYTRVFVGTTVGVHAVLKREIEPPAGS